jgi:hypothetical protein
MIRRALHATASQYRPRGQMTEDAQAWNRWDDDGGRIVSRFSAPLYANTQMESQMLGIYQSTCDTDLQHLGSRTFHWEEFQPRLTSLDQVQCPVDLLMEAAATMTLAEAPLTREGKRSASRLSYLSAHFGLRCAAQQVYLGVAGQDGIATAIHQMTPGLDDDWNLDLKLRPGTYRYRYYADHGGNGQALALDEVQDVSIQMDHGDAFLLCH